MSEWKFAFTKREIMEALTEYATKKRGFVLPQADAMQYVAFGRDGDGDISCTLRIVSPPPPEEQKTERKPSWIDRFLMSWGP